MRRRGFITLLGGAAAAWPLAARAQQGDAKRVAVLIGLPESDPQVPPRIAVIHDGLQSHGWLVGRNIRFDFRFISEVADSLQAGAAELVAWNPDVIFAGNTSSLAALHRETPTIPIVFAQVNDPVGAGFVASLARPGGNITGFALFAETTAVKWPELLKQIAPNVARIGFIHDPTSPVWAGYLRTVEAGASSLGVRVTGLPVHDRAEIERAIEAFAEAPDGGLVVLAGSATGSHRDQIIASAVRHRLPAVYPYRYFVTAGGLASYGIDNIDLYRRAVSYVDRILKGEKPADLPVQLATKFELVINLKTAKALGLTVPDKLLVVADEVIE